MAELTEWQAYDLLEPFGGPRADDRARLIAALIYNANRPEQADALGTSDFLKVWEDPEEAEARALAAAHAWAAGG